MNPLIWLFVGALLGWLAALELGVARPWHRLADMLAGACGAFFAGWVLSAVFEPQGVVLGELSVGNLIGAAFGAVVLLVLVNLVRLIRMP
jgi:uncharacterized membrane protein YeaQ/YmgE (transglycosylase-associated protein family)